MNFVLLIMMCLFNFWSLSEFVQLLINIYVLNFSPFFRYFQIFIHATAGEWMVGFMAEEVSS